MFDFFKLKTTTCERRLLWYEFYPVLAFKAVALGKKRKRFFKTEYLVMWRENIGKKNECVTEWLPEDKLVDRKE
jgi:hypothetical protein